MSAEGIRRRRECARCGLRFTTVERVHTASLFVIKRDGHREEFDPNKLHAGILKACAKRPVTAEAVENLIESAPTEHVGECSIWKTYPDFGKL